MKRVLSIFLCLFASALPGSGQGFSTMGVLGKKIATVRTLLPATVNLSKKRIRVEARVEGKMKDSAELPSLLKLKLTTMIQKDPRFFVDETRPETILRFVVTNFYTEKWTSIPAANQPARDYYRGKIEVSYQAIEAASGRTLDSENLKHTAGYDIGNNPRPVLGIPMPGGNRRKAADDRAASMSINETRDQLVEQIVYQMGRRVSPVESTFEAHLPVKKLEPLSSLAITHRWGTLQEQAEKMDKLGKLEEDTYRVYLIALAKEAQSYELTREAHERDLGKRPDITAQEAAAEFRRAQQFMDEARKLYRDIVEANPKEKVFREGDARTEAALTIYSTIQRFQKEYEQAQASRPSSVVKTSEPQTVASVKKTGPVKTTTNSPTTGGTDEKKSTPLEQVLNFCKEGLEQSVILDYINDQAFLDDAKSSGYKFDIRRDPIALNQGCKDKAAPLQKAMRDRLNRLAPAATRPAAAPAKPATTQPAAKK